ncbi:Cof-type HAD-IIB family hydrolase [Companilactobacillus allii]|uniref:Haloacid dehalogenase n=1 Tax=Companilactobacillus allii TaxID=1847728 RepID=A0A1P8Q600_9LACO|nr:Cof-type HAD-IIB family hydrolase [Companilactobacillus allii]APX73255.1 haloacid dehalogenase [Companilactobacillus allii]USQ68070.1 Cof-type HAD-IIB family hydrolase [Companilactobacillus allii]
MNNNYKGTVFFDLDGTLLNANSKMDPDVSQAVHKLRDNGYLPVISTGRAPNEILQVTGPTGIDTYVTFNGALVESAGKVIYKKIISPETVAKVIEKAKEYNDIITMHSIDKTRSTFTSKFMSEFYKTVKIPEPIVDPKFYEKEELPMILVVTPDGPERYSNVFDELTFYKTGPYAIDTISKGVTKMNGIKHLLSGLELDQKPVYAFGDGPNDLSMIQEIQHSVAMGNGIDSVKEAAEYITSANTDNGIINGLKHYNLI